MKAIVLNHFGGIEALELSELSTPGIENDEVLIKTKAFGINPVDIKSRKGESIGKKLEEREPIILGWDVSGVVKKVGKGVTRFKVGDQVFGMVNFPLFGRCYAEYVAAKAGSLVKKPEDISHAEAAATPLAALTAYQSVIKHGEIQANQKVLIHAASGGVGHFAVQLAKAAGSYVIGTSSAKNRDFILGLGADEHIDYQSQKFEEELSGIDFVLDTIGGDYIDRSLEVLSPSGTLITLPSEFAEEVNRKARLKDKEGFFISVETNAVDLNEITKLISKNLIKPQVLKVYNLENIQEAHKQIESSRTVGKIVCEIL